MKNTPVRLASILGLSLVLAAATPFESPVADAAQAADADRVRTLLQQGADANAAQADGLTAMHWAALNDDKEILDLLMYAGANLKPLTRVGGYTPLHLAARSGHPMIVAALLEAGADANRWTDTGVTALHFAAQANDAASVRALVQHGAKIDAADVFKGRTPLMFAASRDASSAVATLLELGADPSIQTELTDYVAREEADDDDRARRSRVRAAELGEEPRGDPRFVPQAQQPDTANADNTGAPDEEKAEDKEEKKEEEPPVRVLSSIEQIGVQGGFTALHYAARQGHLESAKLLLDAGADIDHQSGGDNSSPLLVAVINGNYDLARVLLERGADPNLVSDDGVGPLFATLNIEWSLRTWYPQPQAFRVQETSYLDLVDALLAAGADPNARTNTHVWYAAYNAGRMGVDFTGATPFWRAAYATDVEAMRLLHSYGADPDIWTTKLPSRRRSFFADPDEDEEEDEDPSGLAPVPDGGPAVHPIHAASGVGFGTSRVAQQHRSVPGGWLPAMKYFVEELGVDPNLRDMDGYSPVHHSAARGDNETILYLVSRGAEVTLVSRRGQTTADMANSPEQRAQPHPATIALLEKLGSKNNHNCQSCGTGSSGGN
ncbi:MAG: ankyrin repeat domain-containing protein [Gemmatimonadota bacterium]|nr:ankyrin repeat domain-containing protein [Gemmatimonadota bacterium]